MAGRRSLPSSPVKPPTYLENPATIESGALRSGATGIERPPPFRWQRRLFHWGTPVASCPALGDLFARRQQAKIAGLLQWGEYEVTIAILTDDDSPVHLIGTRAWIE